MRHYVAIVEDAGLGTAVGVWFPDLPGCFSAGDTIEEAIENAAEAIELYRDALAESGRELPAPRTLAELKRDPAFAADVLGHMVALVAANHPAEAAE